MKLRFDEEVMSEEFHKYHIVGIPTAAALHWFTDKDKGPAHDHPIRQTSQILLGSYWEKVYTVHEDGTWTFENFHRKTGDVFTIAAETIHEIIGLPEGVCLTFSTYGPVIRAWGCWNFDNEKAQKLY